MNDFEFYLSEGSARKRKADFELAKSLVSDAKERFNKISRLDAGVFSKIIFENVYDALRCILDAVLAADGYKSYSHEASIAYPRKYKFEDSIIKELDSFRQSRNSSKYYGKDVPKSDADDIIRFYNEHALKIINIAESKVK